MWIHSCADDGIKLAGVVGATVITGLVFRAVASVGMTSPPTRPGLLRLDEQLRLPCGLGWHRVFA